MNIDYYVTYNDINKSIRDILISKLNISKNLILKLKNKNMIFINNKPALIYTTVKINDKITISFDYEEDVTNILPNKMNLDIIYEDSWILVLNKPAGIPVHPSALHFENTLSNGVRYYYDKINLKKKIRPVNRIDKNTSGLVLFAKNEYIQELLIKEMKNNKFLKTYIAFIHGFLDKCEGTINEPISRKNSSIIERCISSDGKPSITHYKVLEEHKYFSIVECILETGRTHQIRVHFSYLGHPLLGDDLYGGNIDLIDRQALHSYKISLIHPITKKYLEFLAPFPNDLASLCSLY